MFGHSDSDTASVGKHDNGSKSLTSLEAIWVEKIRDAEVQFSSAPILSEPEPEPLREARNQTQNQN